MRLIARRTIATYSASHPRAAKSLAQWATVVEAAEWPAMPAVVDAFSKAKMINGERARFEVAGGDFRLIAAFDFRRQIAFVKFIGTHGEYDRIDAATVEQF